MAALAGVGAEADQYPPPGGAVVAVVEQADAPVAAEAIQELHQGAGALRKLEPIQEFRPDANGVPADHVPHMQLGGFVVRHIDHRVAGSAQTLHHRFAAIRRSDLNAHIDMGFLRIRKTVVEFGDRMVAQGAAEAAEAAMPLLYGDAENHLPTLSHLRPFGDMPQPVEVHVGAADDGHEPPPPLGFVGLNVLLEAGHRQGPGWLRH